MVATDRDFLFLKIISLLKYIFIICACKASSVEIGSVVTLQYKNKLNGDLRNVRLIILHVRYFVVAFRDISGVRRNQTTFLHRLACFHIVHLRGGRSELRRYARSSPMRIYRQVSRSHLRMQGAHIRHKVCGNAQHRSPIPRVWARCRGYIDHTAGSSLCCRLS